PRSSAVGDRRLVNARGNTLNWSQQSGGRCRHTDEPAGRGACNRYREKNPMNRTIFSTAVAAALVSMTLTAAPTHAGPASADDAAAATAQVKVKAKPKKDATVRVRIDQE